MAAGALSGLFGVGGGILIVPALVLLVGFDQRLAHGTSLAAVLPIAAAGLIGYATDDKVDWPVAAFLAVGAIAGAVLGVRALQRLPLRALGLAFAGLMVLSAVRLLFAGAEGTGRSDLTVGSALTLIGFGVLTGALAGLLGVGGGVIMLPAMMLVWSIPTVVAKGTSLAVIVPTSLMATWRNRARGNADLPAAAAVGLAGTVTAYAAAQVSIDLDPDVSNRLFAGLLLVVAARLAWTNVRTTRRGP